MLAQISNEFGSQIKKIAKALPGSESEGKKITILINEAIGFYIMYLDALANEKNNVVILKDLATQNESEEDRKTASENADKIMLLSFRHFTKETYNQYVETKKSLGFPVVELPPIGTKIKLQSE